MNNAVNTLQKLFDGGVYNEINALVNKWEAVCVNGNINGVNAYAFYLDNAAFNADNCKKIIKLYALATQTGSPVVGFYASGGVDLNEGFSALSEYSELLKKAFSVSGVVPQISVIAGECLGVAALMCNTADVVIGIKSNDYYLLANAENRTENSANNGVLDILVNKTDEALDAVKRILALLPQNNLAPVGTVDYAEGAELIDADSFVAFKSDYTDSVDTGLATIGGMPVGIVDFKGNAIDVKAAYKAEQLIKLCNAYNIPVVTFADSTGFAESETSALVTALTKLSSAYANSTTAKISIITKESIGGAFVTLAGKGSNADITIAVDGAVISPMSISSAVAFMFDKRLADGEDRNQLETEYKANNASVQAAAKNGAVDVAVSAEGLREKLIETLVMLSSKRETTIPRKHSVK